LLDIPSTLLDKITQAFQTVGTHADPKMDVIAQKAAKYLSQGSFLQPRTIRTGNSLGPLDICIRRPDKDQEPTEIVMIYIQNGTARVATLPYVSRPDQAFTYKYNLGNADDVACDFDGRWGYISDRSGIYFDTTIIWALETFGEPYFAIVNDGALTVRIAHGDSYLLASNVVKCAMLRGWKSTTSVLVDQGLVCAYIKTDGGIYYRNYCEQEDGSYIWELERLIEDFVAPNSNVSLFRTADYRLGFLAENAGHISWLITHRAWAGMAITPEFISANADAPTITVYDIVYIDSQTTDEYVSADVSVDLDVLYALSPVMLYAANEPNIDDDYGYLVRVRFDERVWNTTGTEAAFTLTDEYNGIWYGQIITGDGTKELLIEFTNFNNASGVVTLAYTPGTATGDIEVLAITSTTFTPIGLVPFAVDPPVVLTIENTIEWEA
jgi:hypothetical protein